MAAKTDVSSQNALHCGCLRAAIIKSPNEPKTFRFCFELVYPGLFGGYSLHLPIQFSPCLEQVVGHLGRVHYCHVAKPKHLSRDCLMICSTASCWWQLCPVVSLRQWSRSVKANTTMLVWCHFPNRKVTSNWKVDIASRWSVLVIFFFYHSYIKNYKLLLTSS